MPGGRSFMPSSNIVQLLCCCLSVFSAFPKGKKYLLYPLTMARFTVWKRNHSFVTKCFFWLPLGKKKTKGKKILYFFSMSNKDQTLLNMDKYAHLNGWLFQISTVQKNAQKCPHAQGQTKKLGSQTTVCCTVLPLSDRGSSSWIISWVKISCSYSVQDPVTA